MPFTNRYTSDTETLTLFFRISEDLKDEDKFLKNICSSGDVGGLGVAEIVQFSSRVPASEAERRRWCQETDCRAHCETIVFFI